MPPPDRPILSEDPQLRDHLIEYIALRDCIGKDLARKIIAAMDVHQLTLLEIQMRGRAQLLTRKIDYEQYRYGLPEHPREIKSDYHPFA
jgi:hypothetical protein